MSYLDFNPPNVCLKASFELDHLAGGKALPDVYIADITVVICEEYYCTVVLIGRYSLQSRNETHRRQFYPIYIATVI